MWTTAARVPPGPALTPEARLFGRVDGAFETTDPRRRGLLGVLVMAGIALLQLATEYLGTRDAGHFFSKAVTLLVGLPWLIFWAFAVFGWASRKHIGVLGPLFVGA